MSSLPASRPFPLSPVTIVQLALIAAGLVLGATVGMGFLVLFGLGAFGPALLREVGLLRDEDEFAREARRIAGTRAYVASGALLVAWIAAREWGHAHLEHDAVAASTVLAALVVTYFVSVLTTFWGARQAAFRILLAFGTLWLAFALLSMESERDVVGALVAAPFFALAFASRRWPRVAGALLLASSLGAAVLFRLDHAVQDHPSALFVGLTFALPLFWCGVALLGEKQDGDET